MLERRARLPVLELLVGVGGGGVVRAGGVCDEVRVCVGVCGGGADEGAGVRARPIFSFSFSFSLSSFPPPFEPDEEDDNEDEDAAAAAACFFALRVFATNSRTSAVIDRHAATRASSFACRCVLLRSERMMEMV